VLAQVACPSPRNIRWTRMLHPSPRSAGRGDFQKKLVPSPHEMGRGMSHSRPANATG
jgi:hypothetical protein